MTAETATLIAAIIAASASLLSLVISAMQKQREEVRIATRLAASQNLDEIGRLIHEVIALSNVLSKSRSEETHKEKHQIARDAADKLKSKRLDVRYSLWGIEEGLRALTRLPDWTAHTKADTVRRTELLEKASKLGEVLDHIIRRTYLTGSLPSRYSRWRVKLKSKQLKAIFDSYLDS